MSDEASPPFKPPCAYVPCTLERFPTLPNPKFAGQPGHGDFSDALAEMDSHVGKTFDAVDTLGIRFSRPGHVGGQLHGSS
jgi:hypothetical protein